MQPRWRSIRCLLSSSFFAGIRRANTAHPQVVTEPEMLRRAHVGLQRHQLRESECLSTQMGITTRNIPLEAGNCIKPRW